VPGYGIAAPGLATGFKEAWNTTGGSEPAAVTLLPAGFDDGGTGRAISSSAPPPAAGSVQLPKTSVPAVRAPAAPSAGAQSPKTERRDYFWLLNAVQECCPAVDANAPDDASRKPLSRGDSAIELVKRLHAESLVGKFGFKIPDTVILRNGKPRKRFSMDPHGRIQVERLSSSAQLLRVLRRYVQLAQKRPALAPVHVPPSPQSQSPAGHRGSGVVGGKVMALSRSEPSLGNTGRSSLSGNLRNTRGAEPLREAAVLYYDDGAVRYMTTAEALKQMENVSRLPKEFWQHIVMLQTPVPVSTSRLDATRYITYCFDASSEGHEPQAPLPLVHRRSNSISHIDFARGQEGPAVAAVPRKINSGLNTKKGRYCNGEGITSGRFEFVLDDTDSSLWLINAQNLFIEQQRETKQDVNSDSDEQIRYFKEDEFREHMREQVTKYEGWKQRWEVQKLNRYEWRDGEEWQAYDQNISTEIAEAVLKKQQSAQVNINGDVHEVDLNLMQQRNIETGSTNDIRVAAGGTDDDIPVFRLESTNASDRLAGVKSPDELLKYYQAETKMLHYYHAIKAEGHDHDHIRSTGGDRALGVCIWFRRWVRAHRGSNHKAVSNLGGRSMGKESGSTRRGVAQRVRSAGQLRHAR